MPAGYLGWTVLQLHRTVCPQSIPVPRRCAGMTTPAWAGGLLLMVAFCSWWPSAGGGLLPAGCRDKRVRVRVLHTPARALPFMGLCPHHH